MCNKKNKSSKLIYSTEEWMIKIIVTQLTKLHLINYINFPDQSRWGDLYNDFTPRLNYKENEELIKCYESVQFLFNKN